VLKLRVRVGVCSPQIGVIIRSTRSSRDTTSTVFRCLRRGDKASIALLRVFHCNKRGASVIHLDHDHHVGSSFLVVARNISISIRSFTSERSISWYRQSIHAIFHDVMLAAWLQ
jgi:hypothetical protein